MHALTFGVVTEEMRLQPASVVVDVIVAGDILKSREKEIFQSTHQRKG